MSKHLFDTEKFNSFIRILHPYVRPYYDSFAKEVANFIDSEIRKQVKKALERVKKISNKSYQYKEVTNFIDAEIKAMEG